MFYEPLIGFLLEILDANLWFTFIGYGFTLTIGFLIAHQLFFTFSNWSYFWFFWVYCLELYYMIKGITDFQPLEKLTTYSSINKIKRLLKEQIVSKNLMRFQIVSMFIQAQIHQCRYTSYQKYKYTESNYIIIFITHLWSSHFHYCKYKMCQECYKV